MKRYRILFAALCLGLVTVVLAGCDRSADAQKREEAINRGEAPAQTGAPQCKLVHGKWLGDSEGCKITQTSCPVAGGTWKEDVGCTAVTTEPDGCNRSGGLAAVDGQCVIATLSATDLDDAWTCHAAQGQWLADTRRCGITEHLCAQSSGEWQPGSGCELRSVAADEEHCTGMSGLHVVNGQCTLVDLSRDDLEQMGSEDVERARSKLNR